MLYFLKFITLQGQGMSLKTFIYWFLLSNEMIADQITHLNNNLAIVNIFPRDNGKVCQTRKYGIKN